MQADYKNFINESDNCDLGTAIQALISDNLRALNTCWLAEITEINDNKVSVRQVIKSIDGEEDIVVNDCLIAYPFSNVWQVQWKLKVGDIGVCICLNRDINLYRETGKSPQLAQTPRFKNINDSIFIPLSLFKTLPNSDINFLVRGGEGDEKNEISFDNENNLQIIAQKAQKIDIKDKSEISIGSTQKIDIKGKNELLCGADMDLSVEGDFKGKSKGLEFLAQNPVKIGCDAGTIKSCFDAVFQAMDLLASGMTGQTTNPAAYNGGKSPLQQQISKIVE